MGEARRRGTFQQRQEQAIEKKRQKQIIEAALNYRKPSPKHMALVSALAGMRVAIKEECF